MNDSASILFNRTDFGNITRWPEFSAEGIYLLANWRIQGKQVKIGARTKVLSLRFSVLGSRVIDFGERILLNSTGSKRCRGRR